MSQTRRVKPETDRRLDATAIDNVAGNKSLVASEQVQDINHGENTEKLQDQWPGKLAQGEIKWATAPSPVE
jgi:hypothetical protein